MNRLRLLRLEKGESLEKIAKYLNVTLQTISNYETEKRDMTPDTLIKLSEYFNVSTDYLLGKTDIRNQEEIETDKINIGLSKKDYNPPTKEQQEKIEEFAKFVLKDNLKKKQQEQKAVEKENIETYTNKDNISNTKEKINM